MNRDRYYIPEEDEQVYFMMSGIEYLFRYLYDDCDEFVAKDLRDNKTYRLPFYNGAVIEFYSKLPNPEEDRILKQFWVKMFQIN